MYYLPYFILGHCLREIAIEGDEKKRKRRISAFTALILYFILDLMETSGIMKLGVILSYVRTISIIIFLYIIAFMLRPYWNKNKCMTALYSFLNDCSKFSLQLYLFNGYLLTVIRTVVCQVLHITSPIWIVLVIWIGNLAITLVACKWIIPYIPVVRELCGLEKRRG